MLWSSITVFRKYINTIFPVYIQQYAVKFNNYISKVFPQEVTQLNFSSHIYLHAKEVKISSKTALPPLPSPSSQGREGKGREGGNMLNKHLHIHSDNIYTRSRKILLQQNYLRTMYMQWKYEQTVKGILAHACEYIKRQAVSYYLSKSCSGHRQAICNYLLDISCRHTVKEQFWKFRSYVIDV